MWMHPGAHVLEGFRESARGPQPFRTLIVVGGVHGDHGADFS